MHSFAVAKRSERVANEFAMLVQRVQMSGELKHGERLTQFLIAMGDQRAAASKVSRWHFVSTSVDHASHNSGAVDHRMIRNRCPIEVHVLPN